jgi:hypothetical protein
MVRSELHTAFVRILEKQRPLETSGLSRVIILKLLLQKLDMYVDWIYVTQDTEVVSFCEEDNEILDSMTGGGINY